MRVHARLEHLKPTPVYFGKGARERRRDGADQVVYGACAASPVDASVFRASPAKVRSLLQVQWQRRRRARDKARQAAAQYRFGRGGDLHRHLERRVVFQDGHGLLIDQRPGIRLFNHVVQAGAGRGFAVDDGPMHGGPAPIFRQQ